ncbi:hypothetical protein [Streptomyces mesophilus]|uniref:hypothetical protein n=1 Tax=Streptomyces mesophilus TaxID=1775132 RepID=UPI00332EEB67
MSRVGTLFEDLYRAEVELARDYRSVAERQVADPGTHYMCGTLARRAQARAERLAELAEPFAADLSRSEVGERTAAAWESMRDKASATLGLHAPAGLHLLHDLRRLYASASQVQVNWVLLQQIAQALRDRRLLDEADASGREVVTEVKWVRTRLKEAAPQALLAAE